MNTEPPDMKKTKRYTMIKWHKTNDTLKNLKSSRRNTKRSKRKDDSRGLIKKKDASQKTVENHLLSTEGKTNKQKLAFYIQQK